MANAPRAATRNEVPVLELGALQAHCGAAGGAAAAPTTNAGGGGKNFPDVLKLARQLGHACETTGFFYVANHGVPQQCVDGLFNATRRYFALPEAERLKDRVPDRFGRGFIPHGSVRHPGFDVDLKESFEFGLELPADDPHVLAGRPQYAPNAWPADKPWLREAGEAYCTETCALARRLLRLFALSLDLPDDYFLEYCTRPMVATRLIHYPPQRAPENEKELGVAPHSDYGLVTLLTQDPVGGLELLKRDGEWVAAPYIPGTFVVNLGDLFSVWTNDRYVSNQHRVVNRSGQERYSTPTFFNPDYDARVACLPQCASAGNALRYAPVTAGEYLVERFREAHGLQSRAPQALRQ